MGAVPQNSFAFLFRTDRGRIGRDVWWRGTLPLLGLAIAGTVGWLLLRPYAAHDLAQTAFIAPATILAFVYLALYTFGLILIAVCHYNLSAKRFRDRGRPGALAGILPGAIFIAGAVIWFIPHSFDTLPEWAASVALALVAAIVVWNIVDLGFGAGRLP